MTAPTLSTSRFPTWLVVASSREPTPRSVRIVSMQGSNTVTTTHTGRGARREPVMDRMTTILVSRSARAALLLPTFFPSSFRSHVLPRAARAHLHSEDSCPSSFQTPHTCFFVCRHRAAPKFQSPGLHLELNRVSRHFLTFSSDILSPLILRSTSEGFFFPFVFQDQPTSVASLS